MLEVKKMLKELNISPDRIEYISIYYEKIFDDKAFPKMEIKLSNIK